PSGAAPPALDAQPHLELAADLSHLRIRIPLASNPSAPKGVHRATGAGKPAGAKPADKRPPRPDALPDAGMDEEMADAGSMPEGAHGDSGPMRPMVAENMQPMGMGPMNKPDPIPSPAPPTPSTPSRIHLVASSDTMSPGDVASLADLRKALRRP